jgi:hypothetical protein
MKTIREVIEILDSLIANPYAFRAGAGGHTLACLRRARQIVKASERRSAKKKGKR